MLARVNTTSVVRIHASSKSTRIFFIILKILSREATISLKKIFKNIIGNSREYILYYLLVLFSSKINKKLWKLTYTQSYTQLFCPCSVFTIIDLLEHRSVVPLFRFSVLFLLSSVFARFVY